MALPPLELFSLKEGAALLPGGSFRFMALPDRSVAGCQRFVTAAEKFDTYPFPSQLNSGTVLLNESSRNREVVPEFRTGAWKEVHTWSSALEG